MTAKVFVKLASKLDAERSAALGSESSEDDCGVSNQLSKSKFSSRFSTGTRFDQLEVEGDNDEGPREDSSLERGNGGIFVGQNRPECEVSLLDDDIPDGFKLVASKHAHLRPQAPHQATMGLLSKDSTGVPSDSSGSQYLSGQKEVLHQVPDPLEHKQWIPPIRSSFWRAYSNKLRVNRIETGICDLTS
jgi:hypothetical protein